MLAIWSVKVIIFVNLFSKYFFTRRLKMLFSLNLFLLYRNEIAQPDFLFEENSPLLEKKQKSVTIYSEVKY